MVEGSCESEGRKSLETCPLALSCSDVNGSAPPKPSILYQTDTSEPKIKTNPVFLSLCLSGDGLQQGKSKQEKLLSSIVIRVSDTATTCHRKYRP